MTLTHGYIVGIPIYCGRNVTFTNSKETNCKSNHGLLDISDGITCKADKESDDFRKLIKTVCNNVTFKNDGTTRCINLIIGLNRKDNPDGLIDIATKVQEFFKSKQKDNTFSRSVNVNVRHFVWQAFPRQQGTNYTAIRNELFALKETKEIYDNFREKNITNIFYLALDPDTQIDADVFKKVEETTSIDLVTPPPLVVAGHYKFSINEDLEIDTFGNISNWEGYLATNESQYSMKLKEKITRMEFVIPRSKYKCIQNIENAINENYNITLQESLKKEELSLKKAYSLLLGSAQSSLDKIKEEEEKIGLDKLKDIETFDGSWILYPPEPAIFISLFQKNKSTTYDLYDFLTKHFANKKVILWGSHSHTEEGETMVATVYQIWKTFAINLSSTPLRKPIKFAFIYDTIIPDRCRKISNKFSEFLPKNMTELSQILEHEETTEELKDILYEIFVQKSQTALSPKFVEQRRRYVIGEYKVDSGIAAKDKPSLFEGNIREKVFKQFCNQYKSLSCTVEKSIDLIIEDLTEKVDKYSDTVG